MLTAVTCLSLAIYHEARGEPIQGQLAVGQVVLNRVASRDYPDTVCDVVTQQKQFSFLDKSTPYDMVQNVNDHKAWSKAEYVSKALIQGHKYDLSATHYHAKKVRPYWVNSPKVFYIATIGNHVFYQEER
jgi:spore germination cell wall hydrolase CwlJ-like protein